MLDDVKVAPKPSVALNLETMPLEELKRLAIAEARETQEVQAQELNPAVERAQAEAKRQSEAAKAEARAERAAERAEQAEEGEVFLASRTIDIGGGAGPEVFSAEGNTREQALENLLDTISEAKLHASRKIRSQQQRIKELEGQQTPALSGDDAYVAGQFITHGDPRGLDLLLRPHGVSVQDIANVVQEHKAGEQDRNVESFLESHPDYVDEGEAGVKNARIMKLRLGSLPHTIENFNLAFEELKAQGLLILRGSDSNSADESSADESNIVNNNAENVSPREQQFRDERGRFQPAQKPQRKSSGISSQSSNRVPPRQGTTEEEAYALPLETLKNRANKQLAEQFGEPTEQRGRVSGTLT